MKYPRVAKRLTFAMNEKNIKAVDLAEKSGVSKASISQYTNGTHCPSNKKAQQLADVLRVNPLWLMDLDDDMHREIITENKVENPKEKEVIRLYSQLPKEHQQLIDNMLITLLSKQ